MSGWDGSKLLPYRARQSFHLILKVASKIEKEVISHFDPINTRINVALRTNKNYLT